MNLEKNSYVDLKRSHKEFKVGGHVYLRVKTRKISLNIVGCAKFESIYSI